MKTYFKVFPKRKPSPGGLNSSEVCVHCRTGFVDFADIFGNGTVLGCYVCGGLFLSSDCREHEKLYKGEQLAEQELPSLVPVVTDSFTGLDVVEGFTSKCGKVFDKESSKVAHERVCKKCKNE